MRTQDAVSKALSCLGMNSEYPLVTEVGHNALLPNHGGRGVYVYVQMHSVWGAAHFTRKGKLVKFERCSFDPEEVSQPLYPEVRIRQWL